MTEVKKEKKSKRFKVDPTTTKVVDVGQAKSLEKIAKKHEIANKRLQVLEEKFQAFCKENKIQGCMFFIDDKVGINGKTGSYKLPSYVTEGLLAVHGYVRR